MNRHSYPSALIGALTLTLLCSACGGGSSSTPVTAPPAAVAPAVTTAPVSQTVAVGASVTFSVSGTGTEPLSYQWQRNGLDVAGATAASYVLPAAALGDTRTTWHVVLRNSAGSATSADASLKVSGIGVLAGLPGTAGNVDGKAADARFGDISGLAFDGAGTLYAADMYLNNALRALTPAGVVSTPFAGLGLPSALASDAAGNVYLAEAGNGQIRKISAAGSTSIVGTVPPCGGRSAPLYYPGALAVDASGAVYVSNQFSVRRIAPSGAVTFLSGSDACSTSGNTASFVPRGLALDGAGNLYVGTGNTIVKFTPDGASSTFATGFATTPRALVVDAQNNLYVADSATNTVRKVTPAGVVSIVAGVAGDAQLPTPGTVQAGPLPGMVGSPTAIAIDRFGDLYVGSNGAIVKIQLP